MKLFLCTAILFLAMNYRSTISAAHDVPSISFKRLSSKTGTMTSLLTLLPRSNVQHILSERLTNCGKGCYLTSFYNLVYTNVPPSLVSGDGIQLYTDDKQQLCVPQHVNIEGVAYDCKLKTDIVYSAPLYVGKTNAYYFGSSDGLFFAYHMPNVLYYHLNLGGDLSNSRPVTDQRGIIYESSSNGYIYAINTDGTLKWQTLVNSQGIKQNIVLGQVNKLYGTSVDGQVFALNRTSGAIIWQQSYHAVTVPAVGVDGTVYIGDVFNNVVAIGTSASGIPTVKWKMNVQGQIRYAPVVDGNGTVYEPSGDEHLWAINANRRSTLKCNSC